MNWESCLCKTDLTHKKTDCSLIAGFAKRLNFTHSQVEIVQVAIIGHLSAVNNGVCAA